MTIRKGLSLYFVHLYDLILRMIVIYFLKVERMQRTIPEEVQKWIEVANGIDEAARVWLKYIFEQAALAETDDSTIEWIVIFMLFGEKVKMKMQGSERYNFKD
ncbi:hypothetical protein [Paenibacillus chitinolyticus]|uniref:hypothetical protein n=1 Tax=Paenibacillus chitinolyticus TaxID=79263 RepID=UPI0036400006